MLNVTEWHFALLFWLSLIQVSIQLVCRPKIEALPGEGGGGAMARVQTLTTFYVNVCECFTLLSGIEQKFFVFVEF